MVRVHLVPDQVLECRPAHTDVEAEDAGSLQVGCLVVVVVLDQRGEVREVPLRVERTERGAWDGQDVGLREGRPDVLDDGRRIGSGQVGCRSWLDTTSCMSSPRNRAWSLGSGGQKPRSREPAPRLRTVGIALASSPIASVAWIAASAAVRPRGVPAASAALKSLGRFAVLPARKASGHRRDQAGADATTSAVRAGGRRSRQQDDRQEQRRRQRRAAQDHVGGPPSGDAPTSQAADRTAPTNGTGR